MVRHILRVVLISAAAGGLMLLPFLPGRHDAGAVALALMAKMFSVAGLLLLLPGLPWLVFEIARNRRGRGGVGADGTWRRRFALASLIASLPVMMVAALGAVAAGSAAIAVLALASWCFVVERLWRRVLTLGDADPGRIHVAPLYVVTIPLAAAILRLACAGPAAEASRHLVMANASPLIAAIEAFHDVRGHYPLSLMALNQDHEPGRIGVRQYHYEPNGEAYNLFFEHPADEIDVREIVMYNPRGEHQMTSHDMDLLEWTGADLDARRGYLAVRDAGRPHWKRFLFD